MYASGDGRCCGKDGLSRSQQVICAANDADGENGRRSAATLPPERDVGSAQQKHRGSLEQVLRTRLSLEGQCLATRPSSEGKPFEPGKIGWLDGVCLI